MHYKINYGVYKMKKAWWFFDYLATLTWVTLSLAIVCYAVYF